MNDVPVARHSLPLPFESFRFTPQKNPRTIVRGFFCGGRGWNKAPFFKSIFFVFSFITNAFIFGFFYSFFTFTLNYFKIKISGFLKIRTKIVHNTGNFFLEFTF